MPLPSDQSPPGCERCEAWWRNGQVVALTSLSVGLLAGAMLAQAHVMVAIALSSVLFAAAGMLAAYNSPLLDRLDYAPPESDELATEGQ